MVVLLVAAGQLVGLVVGAAWFSGWLEDALTEIAQSRGDLVQASVTEAVAAAVVAIEPGAAPDAATRARLQSLVEGSVLPDGGCLSIVGPDGAVICRPGPPDAAEPPVVAERTLPGGLRLRTHRPARAAAAVIDPFVGRTMTIILWLVALLVILPAIVTAVVMRMHEQRMNAVQSNLEGIVDRRSRSLVQSRGAVIHGLAKLAESRDNQTGKHLERIGRYVRILGDELARANPDLDEAFLDTLVETSSLHDIGKVGVPDGVLLSPGRLTDEQREIIEKHPLIGGDTLLAIKRQWEEDAFLVTACEICFAHHERWDGRGYPFGLSGELIPLAARIVALADVYDALTTQRVYKPAMSHDEARRIIEEGAGSHFDPQVVEAFVRREDEFARVAAELDDGASPPPDDAQ
ncbi:MAG: HD-GYP domain-containing protein [Planctomycetota bacterium]